MSSVYEESELKSVRARLAEREKYARRGDTKLRGRVVFIYCESGTMEFGLHGPMLAQLTDGPESGAFVFLQPWAGLPEMIEPNAENCEVCAVPCTICRETGEHNCIYTGCGGRGSIITSYIPCADCMRRGALSLDCTACKGRGEVPYEEHGCPNCKGSGKQVCLTCHGSREMPTGKADRDPQGNPQGTACPECHGSRRKLTMRTQDVQPFIRGSLEGLIAMGPLRGMVCAELPGGDGPTDFKTEADYDGNYPVLLVEQIAPGGRMHLYGGSMLRR